MYAIVDIETTGNSYKNGQITEIAIFRYTGNEITDSFETLIKPDIDIPYFITKMTGINNKMVKDAPKFYEVARRIIEITAGCIFVAHNVHFDYRFLKEEYKRLGYNFNRKKLCTVQLSRKLLPGYPSYSLGSICSALNIDINSRHRASGDAMATVKLFEFLLQKNEEIIARQAKDNYRLF